MLSASKNKNNLKINRMKFKWIKQEIKNLESVKNSDNNALSPLGNRKLKELKLALSICIVIKSLKL